MGIVSGFARRDVRQKNKGMRSENQGKKHQDHPFRSAMDFTTLKIDLVRNRV